MKAYPTKNFIQIINSYAFRSKNNLGFYCLHDNTSLIFANTLSLFKVIAQIVL